MDSTKIASGVRKGKKKQAKDEFDRLKQAEKKRRRLEKALAASAAIRSELEKKKQKKKEEQERLDKEGAAIAEAVALHVLLGEDPGDILYEKNDDVATMEGQSPMPYYYQDLSKHGLDNMDWVHHNERVWDHWGNSNLMVSYGGEAGLSAEHLAVQAVSSLRIGDESSRMDAYVLNNQMLRG